MASDARSDDDEAGGISLDNGEVDDTCELDEDEELFEELERLRESGTGELDDFDEGSADSAWRIDLETALLDEDCDFGTVRNICRGRPVPSHLRQQVWQICLGRSSACMQEFDNVFDLVEQAEIRAACEQFTSEWTGDYSGLALQSDLESVLTHYCKATGRSFQPGNRWLSIARTLLSAQCSNSDQLYSMLSCLLTKYIPRAEPACRVFRLLLQYHEPGVSSQLDSLRLGDFAAGWFNSLLSDDLANDVLLPLWDIYFLLADPFLIFFIGLVFVVNCKDSLGDVDADAARAMLIDTPRHLEVSDVEDLCSLAQHYACRTPSSLRTLFTACLFGEAEPDSDLLMCLCLPVSIAEVTHEPPFSIVDVRSPQSYNQGHLPNAFNLDSGLLLTNPTEFDSVVSALVRTAQGPMCISGHGRRDEDTTTVLVAAQLLRRQCPGVSLFIGGYAAVHKELGATGLADHCASGCAECARLHSGAGGGGGGGGGVAAAAAAAAAASTATGDGKSIMAGHEQLLAKLKTKAGSVVTKLSQLNPLDSVGNSNTGTYRNTGDVFASAAHDDDEDEAAATGNEAELVNLSLWQSEAVSHYSCSLLTHDNRSMPGHMVLKPEHLYLLRSCAKQPGMATIVARRPLVRVVKITSKKKYPELITFKYGDTDAKGVTHITDMDRLIIPKAGEATKDVKMQIIKLVGA